MATGLPPLISLGYAHVRDRGTNGWIEVGHPTTL